MTDSLRADFMSGMDEIERATDPKTWAESGPVDDERPKKKTTPSKPEDDLADFLADDDLADEYQPDEDFAAGESPDDSDGDETDGGLSAVFMDTDLIPDEDPDFDAEVDQDSAAPASSGAPNGEVAANGSVNGSSNESTENHTDDEIDVAESIDGPGEGEESW